MTLRLSVVVPTYNRLDTLRHVIPSLVAQDLRGGAVGGVRVGDDHLELTAAQILREERRDHVLERVETVVRRNDDGKARRCHPELVERGRRSEATAATISAREARSEASDSSGGLRRIAFGTRYGDHS